MAAGSPGVVWLALAAVAALMVHGGEAMQGPLGAHPTSFDWQWKEGRASWFGDGHWPIHIGGCNYDYIWKDEGTGYDVVALPDVHPEYVGSCGACWEVQCANGRTKDFFGEQFDRSVCRDESASVIVRSVDTCQCVYPANAYSNKRWCCGDMDHLDLSKWAFEKLAELKWGVIKLRYRSVPCDYQPPKRAWVSNPSPGIPEYPPSNAKRQTRDWPDYRSKSITARAVFDGYLQNGFKDVSWGAWMQNLEDTKNKGMLGGRGMCATVSNKGAFALRTYSGIFQNTVAIEFWTYVGFPGNGGHNAKIPDITVSISGPKGGCAPVRVMNIKPHEFQPTCKPFCTDYYWGFRAYLPAFSGSPASTVINDPRWFNGCGGNSVWDLNTIEFRHDGYGGTGNHYFCLDRVLLV